MIGKPAPATAAAAAHPAKRRSWFERPPRAARPRSIVTVELREAIRDIDAAPGHDVEAVALLDGVPLGTVHLPVTAGRVPAQEVAAAFELALGDVIVDELLVRAVLGGRAGHGDARAIAEARDARPASPNVKLPSLTIAVCTRDRPDDLRRCLDAINASDLACDVLVVDNAPTDDRTKRVVDEFGSVRYAPEPNVGLNWARNRAVSEAHGDIVAFVDDDVLVDRAWAGKVAQAFAEDPDLMCVTGLVLPAELEHEAQLAFEEYGGFGKGFRRTWYRAELGAGVPRAGHLWGTGNCGTGANMAFRRSVFAVTGLFDPALDVGTLTGGCGDLEMFFRVLKHGWTLLYDPAAFVWHRHRRTLTELDDQIRGFGSVACFVQAAARRFPDERFALYRGEVAYVRSWHLPTIRRALRPSDGSPRLARLDLAGHARSIFGRRYERAVRVARSMGAGDVVAPADRSQAELPALQLPALQLPAYERSDRTAIRRVSIDHALEGLSDLAGYRSALVFIERGGCVVGKVSLDCQGRPISGTRLARGIVDSIGLDLLVAPQLYGDTRRDARRHARAALLELLRVAETPAANQAAEPNPHDPVSSVSIVISTVDRPESLRRCLASLESFVTLWQQSFEVEVIVVQNGPDDPRTTDVVHQFGDVKLIIEPRRGVSYGRNAGLAAATGELVAILDDDEIVGETWLPMLLAPFADESVGAVTGNVLPAELETHAQLMFEQHSTLSRGHEPRRAGPRWLDGARPRSMPPTWDFGGTANMAIRRCLFEDPHVGPFDEVLGPGTPTGVGEDTMLFYRVLARGFEIVYEPRAVAWHYHRHSFEALLRQQKAYYSGHVSYSLMTFLRHGDVRGLTHFRTFWRWHVNELIRTRPGGDLPRSLWRARVAGSLAGPGNVARSAWRARRLRASRVGLPEWVRASKR